MKRFVNCAGVAALLSGLALGVLGTARPAAAQDLPEDHPFEIKIGAYLPSYKEGRQAGNDAQFVIEGEYAIQNDLTERLRTHTKIGIGYTETRDLRIIPLTLSETFQSAQVAPGTGFYYGVGLGLYFTRFDTPDTDGSTKTLVGGFGVAGMNFGGRMFAEAKYHIVSHYNSKRIDGLQLAAGVRF